MPIPSSPFFPQGVEYLIAVLSICTLEQWDQAGLSTLSCKDWRQVRAEENKLHHPFRIILEYRWRESRDQRKEVRKVETFLMQERNQLRWDGKDEKEGTEMQFQRIKSCCLTLVAVLKINGNEELCVFLSQKEDTCLCISAEPTALGFVRLGKSIKENLKISLLNYNYLQLPPMQVLEHSLLHFFSISQSDAAYHF